jgi:hypothetical protein
MSVRQNDLSGLVSVAMKMPSRTPCSMVSRISFCRSIFGSLGFCANAPSNKQSQRFLCLPMLRLHWRRPAIRGKIQSRRFLSRTSLNA